MSELKYCYMLLEPEMIMRDGDQHREFGQWWSCKPYIGQPAGRLVVRRRVLFNETPTDIRVPAFANVEEFTSITPVKGESK